MSHNCQTCKGSGRITDVLKGVCRYKKEEVILLDKIFELIQEGSFPDAEYLQEVPKLRDKLYRPVPKDKRIL